MGISLNEFPSKKFNNIWNDGICFHEVNNIITHSRNLAEAYTWMRNFQKNFSSHLEKNKVIIQNNTLEKRCRDLYYIVYDVLYKLKIFKENTQATYNPIKSGIKTLIDSAFLNIGNGSCLSSLIHEVDYESANVMKKKYVDDLGEDITYIEPKIDEINRSLECDTVKTYLEAEILKIKLIYEENPENYKKILQYYKKDNFDHFEKVIAKIKCTSEKAQEKTLSENQETPANSSPLHIFLVSNLSLFGFLLIFFFLYKVTPLKSWFDRRIRKKVKFLNSTNDAESNKISEEESEYLDISSNNDEYNVLYNSVADS
ncbi:PIR Superfamily Protein [Plasmodium ovale wallikeri]|uniref:PIR Superfamily Protein n=1 Tax=Plasmodium ovale wallikeri TaxID=864142 RepID=A0A1A9AMS1_PLAOA|nr:PIR Superfamily Protein [Plasmodium ovale wallikeri]SBT57968.1 PIR Superfamily Protein [Plasmodium ovale wallikeri]